MRHFQNLPVKHKITAITLLTILVVSLISSTVFVTIEGRGGPRRFLLLVQGSFRSTRA